MKIVPYIKNDLQSVHLLFNISDTYYNRKGFPYPKKRTSRLPYDPLVN